MPPSPSIFAALQARLRGWTSPVRQRVGAVMGVQVGGLALGYVLNVLLARWMPTAAYGAYAYALSWASFLAVLGSLGFPEALLRFVPEYAEAGRLGHLRGVVRTARRFTLGVTGTLAALGSALVLWTRPVAPALVQPLAAGLWLTPLLALVLVETEVLRARKRVVWAYAPVRLGRTLLVLAGVGALAWAGAGLLRDAATAPLAALGVTALALALVWGVQRAAARRALPPGARHAPPPATGARRWLRVALPLLLARSFLLVIAKTDLFVLGFFEGADAVGRYYVALRVAQAVTLVGFAMDAVAAPLVAERYHGGTTADVQRLATRLVHGYFWPTLALAGGLALAAGPLLGLFGPAYRAAHPLVLVLLVGLLAHAATGVQTYLLTLTGRERLCTRVFGWSALLNVGLTTAGVWLFGAMGAAAATAVTAYVWNAWLRVLVQRHLGVRPTIVDALRPTPSRATPDEP